MGFRGSSLSYSAPPFPSPVPTAAATTTSSSSSSTLSPLAPPFTVERTFSKPPLTYDAYASPRTPWPQPSDENSLRHQPPDPPPPSGSFPPHAYEVVRPHRRPTLVPDIARDGSVNGVGGKNLNLAQAEPYFPRSNSIEAASGGDLSRDRSDSGSGYLGALTSVLDFPFGKGAPEEGVIRASSWMDPEDISGAPGFGASVGQACTGVSTAPGFAGYEDLQGDWHVKNSESTGKNLMKYEDYGCSGTMNNTAARYAEFTPSAGMCYPHLSDVNTFMKGSKISDSDSLYERYFCEASRERTDSGNLYSDTFFPAKILASSSITSTTNSLEHVSHPDHVNSQNSVPQRGQIFYRAVGPSINSKFEHKEDYAGANIKEGNLMVDVASLNPTVVKITSPLSIEASKQIPGDIIMGKKSELRITSPHLPCSIECNHDQSFSERLDDHSAEDSPCWKGMPSSRFSVLNTSGAFADCGLERKKLDTPSKSDCPKLENEGGVLHSYGLREDSNVFITLKDHGHDFGPKNENVTQTANERKNIAPEKNEVIAGVVNHGTQLTWGDSSASFSLVDTQLSLATKSVDNASNDRINPAVVTDPLERNLMFGIDVQLLVKSIHNLSELLLSSCRVDASLLKEQDRELLSSAVNNLEVCTSGKHEPEISGPGLLHKSGTYFCRQFPVLSELSMDENICGKGENHQVAYDDSLWTNVEDALLLLKSRLKKLKSNVMVDKCKQRTKDPYFEASDVTGSVSQNCPGDIAREIMLPWKSTDTSSTEITTEDKQETLNNPLKKSPTVKSKRAEVDATVLAKFNILKHRNDSLNLVNGQEQHGFLTLPGGMSNHPSTPEGGLNCLVQFQPVKVAPPTGWESQQPFHSGRTEDANSERGSSARPRHMAVGHSHMHSPHPEQKVAEGFYARSIRTPANESYAADRRSVKHLMTGIDGSSSDWEHVLEEDATW